MSGFTPQWSIANHLPVRPHPAITSSSISRTPWRSQISRSRGIYSGGGTSTPFVPTTGSTITAATSLIHDHVFEVVDAGDIAGRIGVLDGAVVAVDLGSENKPLSLAARLHRPAPRVARRTNRGRGRTVVRPVPRNDLGLA